MHNLLPLLAAAALMQGVVNDRRIDHGYAPLWRNPRSKGTKPLAVRRAPRKAQRVAKKKGR